MKKLNKNIYMSKIYLTNLCPNGWENCNKTSLFLILNDESISEILFIRKKQLINFVAVKIKIPNCHKINFLNFPTGFKKYFLWRWSHQISLPLG